MTVLRLRRVTGALVSLALFAGAAGKDALASGYQVGHESVTGAGTAYAGGTAGALDASTVFYNPAGMMLINRNEIMVGGHLIDPRVEFEDAGSTIFNGDPLSGGDGGDGGVFVALPNIYGVWKYSDNVRFGLSVNVPWGLITDYDWDWQGRYNEITTSLKVINVNPSAAVRLTDAVSIGAGFNVQLSYAKLRQSIDFGTVCASALGLPVCQGAFGLTPQNNDGLGFVNAEDVGYGFNVGLHFHPTPQTRLGIHYRSKVKLGFDGETTFSVPIGARAFLTAAGIPTAFTDTDVTFDLNNPETISIGVYQELSPAWAVMADVNWLGWSPFPEVRFVFDEPTTPDNILETQWSNSIRVSAGATYRYNDDYLFRAGLAYNETPIDDEFRGAGVPDSDRIIVAAGFSKRLSESATFEFAYQHMFLEKGPTARPSTTGSVLLGNFDVNVDVISMGFVMGF